MNKTKLLNGLLEYENKCLSKLLQKELDKRNCIVKKWKEKGKVKSNKETEDIFILLLFIGYILVGKCIQLFVMWMLSHV